MKDLLVDSRRQAIERIGVANGRHVHQRLFLQFVWTFRTVPILPTPLYGVIQTDFIVRAKDISIAPFVKGIRIRFHSHLTLYGIKSLPICGGHDQKTRIPRLFLKAQTVPEYCKAVILNNDK